jgi:hypothetical protein
MTTPPKRFSMQDGPDIDWETAELIYKEYSALYGTGQSLERINERGGFGWAEVALIRKQYNKKFR